MLLFKLLTLFAAGAAATANPDGDDYAQVEVLERGADSIDAASAATAIAQAQGFTKEFCPTNGYSCPLRTPIKKGTASKCTQCNGGKSIFYRTYDGPCTVRLFENASCQGAYSGKRSSEGTCLNRSFRSYQVVC